jgi:hypothetical protein
MKKCNSFFLKDLLIHIISENCSMSHIVRYLTMHLPNAAYLLDRGGKHYKLYQLKVCYFYNTVQVCYFTFKLLEGG